MREELVFSSNLRTNTLYQGMESSLDQSKDGDANDESQQSMEFHSQ